MLKDTMKAIKFLGKGQISLEEVPTPKAHDDSVVVKVTASGLAKIARNRIVCSIGLQYQLNALFRIKHP